MRKLFKALLLSGAALAVSTAAYAEGSFQITSSSFEDSALMDSKYAGKGGPRKCDGENISPAFSWTNAPEDTQSFILLSHDDSGHRGMGVIHWVLYHIPGDVTGFGEGEIPEGASEGPNITGRLGWQGPCPLPGEHPHYYEFTLIATKLAPDHFGPEMTRGEILSQLEETAIAATSIVGRYGR